MKRGTCSGPSTQINIIGSLLSSVLDYCFYLVPNKSCFLLSYTEITANKIVNTKGQLESLIRLSKSTGNEEVKIESCRLLALIVKHGSSQGKNSIGWCWPLCSHLLFSVVVWRLSCPVLYAVHSELNQFSLAEVSHKMITGGGLPQIVEIVTSPRLIVQNEALIAMTVIASSVKRE